MKKVSSISTHKRQKNKKSSDRIGNGRRFYTCTKKNQKDVTKKIVRLLTLAPYSIHKIIISVIAFLDSK